MQQKILNNVVHIGNGICPFLADGKIRCKNYLRFSNNLVTQQEISTRGAEHLSDSNKSFRDNSNHWVSTLKRFASNYGHIDLLIVTYCDNDMWTGVCDTLDSLKIKNYLILDRRKQGIEKLGESIKVDLSRFSPQKAIHQYYMSVDTSGNYIEDYISRNKKNSLYYCLLKGGQNSNYAPEYIKELFLKKGFFRKTKENGDLKVNTVPTTSGEYIKQLSLFIHKGGKHNIIKEDRFHGCPASGHRNLHTTELLRIMSYPDDLFEGANRPSYSEIVSKSIYFDIYSYFKESIK